MIATIEFRTNGKNYHYEVEVGNTPAGHATFEAIQKIYKELKVKKATNQQFTLSEWNFWVGYII